MRLHLAMLVLVATGSAQADPVATALADARSLPPVVALQTRYLTLDVLPLEWRGETRAAGNFWANGLSVIPDITRLRIVGLDVVALYLPDYNWSVSLWEKLGPIYPYHDPLVLRYINKQVSVLDRNAERISEIRALHQITGSYCPVLRLDWWVHQVQQQADRKVGYYDFLGVGKKRADFEKLVGLDRALAVKMRKEVAAVVDVSEVTVHNRQFRRYQTLNGVYYESLDVTSNTGQQNAVRFLDKDFIHQFEEVYASLPNGLFAFLLCNAAGDRADSAPDNVASDRLAPGTDRRVINGISCARCHIEGIRPIDCWARKTYSPPEKLAALDPIQFLRLRQLYLSDLNRLIRRDQSDYAEALLATNGLTPGDNAKIVAVVSERYDQSLSLDDLAREMGTTVEKFQAAIRAKELRDKPLPLDPILTMLGKDPAKGMTIRREHAEEFWPLLMELKP